MKSTEREQRSVAQLPGGVVAITGMHRSGTSMLAGLIELCGVDLGDPASHLPPGSDNPKGYWEHRSVKELDDDLLAHLGGTWDQPPVLEPGWAEAQDLNRFRRRCAELLGELFGHDDRRLVGFKDPRLSLLLPLWMTATPVTSVVAIVRDPREVASSLAARNGLPRSQSALLWLRYLLAAVHDAPSILLVTHDALFTDVRSTLNRLCRHLSLPQPDEATIVAAGQHVDPSLRHHEHHQPDETASTNPLEALAAEVYNAGDLALDTLDPLIADALRRGWLRPPADTALLDHARTRMIQMESTMRARRRRALARAEAAAGNPSPTDDAGGEHKGERTDPPRTDTAPDRTRA